MTSTDIALPGDANLPAEQPAPPPAAYAPLVQQQFASDFLLWMEEARLAASLATSLAKTSFVPASLRGKPADITAALLAGKELGMQPITSLRSMDIIQGTPALRAHAMRALAQGHGHKVWLVEQSAARVVMRGQRREADGSYGPVQESVWDIPRAALLGLTGKEQWKKQPQTMLTARATGEICRLVASDALHAMPYAAEELADSDPIEVVPSAPRVTADEILATPEPAGVSVAGGAVDSAVDEPEWPATAQPGDGA